MKKVTFLLIFFIFLAGVAWGQHDYTWNGGGGNLNWDTPGNWTSVPVGGTYPGANPNDNAIIPSGGDTWGINVTFPLTLNSLLIERAGSLNLNNNTLTVTNLTIGGTFTSSQFSFNNAIINVTGILELNNIMQVPVTSSMTVKNLKVAPGTAGIRTNGGPVTMGGGTITINPDNPGEGIQIGPPPASSSPVTGDIGDIDVGNRSVTITIGDGTGDISIGDINTTGDVIFNGGEGNNISVGEITAGGNVNINTGTGTVVEVEDVDAGGTFNSGPGVTVGDSSTIANKHLVIGAGATAPANVTFYDGTVVNAADFQYVQFSTLSGNVTRSVTGTGMNIVLLNPGTNSNITSATFQTQSGFVDIQGTYTTPNGSLTITPTGDVVYLSGGAATLTTTSLTISTFDGRSNSLTINGASAQLSYLNNFGTIAINAGVNAAIGTISSTAGVVNNGTLDLGSGDIAPTSFTNNGILRLTGAGSQTINQAIVGGTVEFYGNGTTFAGITSFNNLTISEGARLAPTTLTVSGTWNVNAPGSFAHNNGTVNFSNGAIVNSNNTFNLVNVTSGATVTFNGSNTFSSLNAATGSTAKFANGSNQTITGLLNMAPGSTIEAVTSGVGQTRWHLYGRIEPDKTVPANLPTIADCSSETIQHNFTASPATGADAINGGNNNSNVFQITGSYTWTGADGAGGVGLWDEPDNWTPAVVPPANAVIIIPDTANKPELTANVTCNSLEIQTGAVIDLKEHVLTVTLANGLENDGTIKLFGMANQVRVNGATPTATTGTIRYYDDPTTTGAGNWVFGNNYYNLIVDSTAAMGAAGALVADNVEISSNIAAASVTVSGTSKLGANITTSNNQFYAGIELTGNVTLVTTLTGAALTTGAITGHNHNLGLNSANTTIAGGSGIGTLTIDGNAAAYGAISAVTLIVNPSAVFTLGSRNFTATTITNNGTILLDGSQTVTPAIIGGTGTVNFNVGGNALAGIREVHDLIISAGTRTAAANLKTNNDLTINTGASLNMGVNTLDITNNLNNSGALETSGKVNLYGSAWNNTGTFTANAETVYFNNSNTIIGGNNTFYNVNLIGPGGVFTINGNNTAHELIVSSGNTAKFANGSTQTITALKMEPGSTIEAVTSGVGQTHWDLFGKIEPDNTVPANLPKIADCQSDFKHDFSATDADNHGNNIFVFKMVYTWTGAVSTVWDLVGNWEQDVGVTALVLPQASDDIQIHFPYNNNKPNIIRNLSYKSLTIESGAELDIKGFSLTLTGNLPNTLTNNGTIELYGMTNQVIVNGADPTATTGKISYYDAASPTTGAGHWVFGNNYHDLTVKNSITMQNGGALNVTANAEIGSAINAASFTVSGTSEISANITTTAAAGQHYQGVVTLDADLTLNAGSANPVVFTVPLVGSAHDLTITGAASLNGTTTAIGVLHITGRAAFDSTAFEATSIEIIGTSAMTNSVITTTAAAGQHYQGALTLGGDVVLNATNTANTIIFGGLIGGGDSLTISNGNASFVGTSAAIGTLEIASGNAVFTSALFTADSIHVSGTSAISAGITTTETAGQTYTGAVTLGADVTLNAGSANPVIFTAPLAGSARNLTITGAAGLNGTTTAVGALHITGSAAFDSTAFEAASIQVIGTSTMTDSRITSTAGQTYGVVNLSGDVELDAAAAANTIIFGGLIGGGDSLKIINGTASFVGTSAAIGTLEIVDGDAVFASAHFTADSIKISGISAISVDITTIIAAGQNYQGDVNITGVRTLTAENGEIIFTTGKTLSIPASASLNIIADDGIDLDCDTTIADVNGIFTLASSGDITIAGNINTVLTRNGIITIKTIDDANKIDININGNIYARRLIVLAPGTDDPNDDDGGTVIAGAAAEIRVSDTVGHEPEDSGSEAAIYMHVHRFTASDNSSIENIIPGDDDTGRFCISSYYFIPNNRVKDKRYHHHQKIKSGKNLVFAPNVSLNPSNPQAPNYLPDIDFNDENVFQFIDSTTTLAEIFTVSEDKDIYLVDNADGIINPELYALTFTTKGSGKIHFWNDFVFSHALTLHTDSVTGGIHLKDADIQFTGTNNSFNTNGAATYLDDGITGSEISTPADILVFDIITEPGDSQSLTLTANNITLDGNAVIDGILTINNSGLFTLAAGSELELTSSFKQIGTTGSSTLSGNINVTGTDPTPAPNTDTSIHSINFNDVVTVSKGEIHIFDPDPNLPGDEVITIISSVNLTTAGGDIVFKKEIIGGVDGGKFDGVLILDAGAAGKIEFENPIGYNLDSDTHAYLEYFEVKNGDLIFREDVFAVNMLFHKDFKTESLLDPEKYIIFSVPKQTGGTIKIMDKQGGRLTISGGTYNNENHGFNALEFFQNTGSIFDDVRIEKSSYIRVNQLSIVSGSTLTLAPGDPDTETTLDLTAMDLMNNWVQGNLLVLEGISENESSRVIVKEDTSLFLSEFNYETHGWAYIQTTEENVVINITDPKIKNNISNPELILEIQGDTKTLKAEDISIGSLHIYSDITLLSDLAINGKLRIDQRGNATGVLNAGSHNITMRAGISGKRNIYEHTHAKVDNIKYARWELISAGDPPADTSSDPSNDMNDYPFIQSSGGKVIFESYPGDANPNVFFEIIGSTIWQDFECKVPGAIIQFSMHPYHHVFLGDFIIQGSESKHITLTRYMEDTSGRYKYKNYINDTTVPPSDPALSGNIDISLPSNPASKDLKNDPQRNKFWNFNYFGNEVIRNTDVFFSHAWNQRLPLNRDGLKIKPYFRLGQGGDPNEGQFNYDWGIDYHTVIYSFAEDADGNGRVDRIRVQSNVVLNKEYNGASQFSQFSVNVEGYEVKGYELVSDIVSPISVNDEMEFYIYLNEQPFIYDGKPLSWRITGNYTLRDNITKDVLIGEYNGSFQLPDNLPYKTTNTIPPRISYALTLPGYNQTFFRFSQPVDIGIDGEVKENESPTLHNIVDKSEASDEVFKYLSKTTQTITFSGKPGALSYLFDINKAPSAEELAALPPIGDSSASVYFTAEGFTGISFRALDWNDDKLDPESYIYYPSPRYPKDWNYSAYETYMGNTGIKNENGEDLTPDNDLTLKNTVFVPPYKALSPGMVRRLVDYANGVPNVDKVIPDDFDDTENLNYEDELKRRSTDVLVSINLSSGNYFAWPIWAKHVLQPGSDGETEEKTSIWYFDGSKFLEARGNIDLQANMNPVFSGTLDLFWAKANKIDTDLRNPEEAPTRGKNTGGLWQPDLTELNEADPLYSVPSKLASISSGQVMLPLFIDSAGNQSFIYTIGGNLESGYKLEFIFRIKDGLIKEGGVLTDKKINSEMFIACIDIPNGSGIPGDWYKRIRPFSFDIQDPRLQRGGVTIMNNVINSDKKEQTYLRYHLVRPGRVTIQVYTLDGSLVKSIRRNEQRAAGEWVDTWDGTNNGGRSVARGMYFIRVVGPDIDEIRKVMVVK